nr:hypothetical protein Itr_chr11CG08260 [Ipomoea trifida]
MMKSRVSPLLLCSPPAARDGGAASEVRADGAGSHVAVVGVIRPAGTGRAGDPIRRECAVGDVVPHCVPEQRSPATRRRRFFSFQLLLLFSIAAVQ